MSFQVNINIDQGANYIGQLIITQQDGTVFNLSTYTINAQLRTSSYSNNSTSFTIVDTDKTNGKFNIAMTATQTQTLKPYYKYVYDVEATSASNNIIRLVEGWATINAGVTI